MTETWLHNDVENSIVKMRGYKRFGQDGFSFTHSVKAIEGGGVLVYVKNKWASYLISMLTLNTVTTDLESYWLK